VPFRRVAGPRRVENLQTGLVRETDTRTDEEDAMARYVDEYQGIAARDMPARGMDPNFRGAYGGMRMHGGPYQAEYGRHRMRHPGDFERWGGAMGAGERRMPRGAADWRGGVRDIRYDRELLHDFNANSPALQRGRGGRDLEPRRPLPRGIAPWSRPGRAGYSNRGISDGGYSEGWAWGPMRGAR
jgi:hypothetical protein